MAFWSDAAAKLMRFFGGVSHALYPDTCVGCQKLLEKHESVFCTFCERHYIEALERECGRCFRPRSRCVCSRKTLEEAKIVRLVKLYTYRARRVDLPQNRLIFALKHHHRTDVRCFLASELSSAISEGIKRLDGFVLTYAPRGRKSVVKDGYDHISELTEELSGILNLPLVDAVGRRPGGKIQKKLSYTERRKNMTGRFYLKNGVDLAGKSVLLVDDVVTSGATMMEAARILYASGVKEVVGVVISATGRDERRKPRRFSVKYRTMK